MQLIEGGEDDKERDRPPLVFPIAPSSCTCPPPGGQASENRILGEVGDFISPVNPQVGQFEPRPGRDNRDSEGVQNR